MARRKRRCTKENGVLQDALRLPDNKQWCCVCSGWLMVDLCTGKVFYQIITQKHLFEVARSRRVSSIETRQRGSEKYNECWIPRDLLVAQTDTDRAYVGKLTDKVWERQEIGERNQESGRASQQGRLVNVCFPLGFTAHISNLFLWLLGMLLSSPITKLHSPTGHYYLLFTALI